MWSAILAIAVEGFVDFRVGSEAVEEADKDRDDVRVNLSACAVYSEATG